MPDDYDTPWKEAIERHFADFLLFFFPNMHAQVDWSQPVSFLDQTLRSVVRDAEFGARFADKLVQLTRLGGQAASVYIHIEIQGTEQAEFSERMFVYHYRLFDRYRKPVASLAVLADDRQSWRPEKYSHELFECGIEMRFPTAKLLDWTGNEARLEDSDNPFALVTLAHLMTRATRGDMAGRYEAKTMLARRLYRRGKNRQQIVDLMWMIDWMMRLPKDLETRWRQSVQILEEEIKMPYVSSFEREGIARGFEKGMAQGIEAGIEKGIAKGIEKGIEKGILTGEMRLLARLLSRRFGELPPWARSRLDAATNEDLQAWTDAVLSASSIDEVFSTPLR